MEEYELFNKNSQAVIFGLQDKAIQRMLDFDYLSGRETPSVGAIINPSREGLHKVFFGGKEILIPIYRTLQELVINHPSISVMINFASFRSAYATTKEALDIEQFKTIVIIAEGVPERQSRILAMEAKKKGKWLIGPATVGGVMAGQFKIANTGGTIENIINSKLYRSGSVGFVSKSGGMSNEMYNVISRNSNGIYEGIAIGGDAWSGSTLLDHLIRYEQNPNIKMLVVLGEVGGKEEYQIAEAFRNKLITKPLVAWVTGTCAKEFPTEVQFGHAGAKSGVLEESADAKNKVLVEAGVIVPNSFNDFGDKIKEVFDKLNLPEIEEPTAREIPPRKATEMICSISNDTGEEATYNGLPISKVVENQDWNIGKLIGLLWLKKDLPEFACNYIEMIIKTVADHGPCVAGAHNTIVAARAGKDLMSSLASGLLTIGPRFGGAIDGAAQYFYEAFKRGLTPAEFVKEMKGKNINISGIGHKIKSVKNPDKRVSTLLDFVFKNFVSSDLLNFALEVEKITTAKKGNLILNVDGCIGVTFVDMMRSLPDDFNEKDIREIIDIGFLNGLFVLARSIGMMGHYFDQKRYKQGLYRYPQELVLYTN